MNYSDIIKQITKERNALEIKCKELSLKISDLEKENKVTKMQLGKANKEIKSLKADLDVITADRDLILQDYNNIIEDKYGSD